MRVNHSIRNLNGGITQQPVESRFDNQAEELENCVMTKSSGLRRRNPVRTVTNSISEIQSSVDRFVHYYDRGDGSESYMISIAPDDTTGKASINVIDKNGNEKSVVTKGYSPLLAWDGYGANNKTFEYILDEYYNYYVVVINFGGTTGTSYGYDFSLRKEDIMKWLLEVDENGNFVNYILGSPSIGVYTWYKLSDFYIQENKKIPYFYIADQVTATGFPTPSVTNTYGSFDINQYAVILDMQRETYRDTFKAITVGDTTWIVDKNVITSMSDSVTGKNSITAFYWIKKSFDNGQGGGYTYEVILNGTKFSTSSTNTLSAATALAGSIDVNASYTARAEGSIVYIKRTDNASFTFEFGDSFGNQASSGWTDSVAALTDLPYSMAGFTNDEVGVIAITGNDKDNFNSYYVKWNTDHWSETAATGLLTSINELSMPCKLVRQSDGSFVLGFNKEFNGVEGFNDEFTKRSSGDNDSNPIPSFIGNTISNMFFFKNRLCLVSDENIIMSKAGRYYTFFASTVMEILDDDVIDVSIDSDTVSSIRNVTVTSNGVTLWADGKQFFLQSSGELTPTSISIGQISSYTCDNSLSPVVVDNEIVFVDSSGDYLDVFSYNPAIIESDRSSAESISAQVPTLLPSTINTIVPIPSQNLIVFKDTSSSDLYIYRYEIYNGKKIMSSWSKFTFGDKVYTDIAYVNDKLWMVCGTTNKIVSISFEYKNHTDSDFYDVDTSTGSNNYPYTSKILLTGYNIEVKGNSSSTVQATLEPMYISFAKVSGSGSFDIRIKNSERGTSDVLTNADISREIYIGGSSYETNIGFESNKATGFQINSIAINGSIRNKEINI